MRIAQAGEWFLRLDSGILARRGALLEDMMGDCFDAAEPYAVSRVLGVLAKSCER